MNLVSYHNAVSISPATLDWNEQGEPFAKIFGDRYFNSADGLEETQKIFIETNQLSDRWQYHDQTFVIAELGFGSGLNCFATWKHFIETAPSHQILQFVSVEQFPFSLDDFKRAAKRWDFLKHFSDQYIAHYPPLIKGCHRRIFGRVIIDVWFEEATTALSQMEGQVDAWFLDGFSPAKNPQMWEKKLFEEIARLSKKNTTFSTFTAASQVRRDLLSVGFHVEKLAGFGTKRERLWGYYLHNTPFSKLPPWFQLIEYKEKNATIIGAGLAGTSAALSLQRRGWQCKIIEKQQVASGASKNHVGACYPKLNVTHDFSSQFYNNAFSFARHHFLNFTEVPQGWDGVFFFNQQDIFLQEAGWISPYALCVAQAHLCEIEYRQFKQTEKCKNLTIFANGWEAEEFFPFLPLTPVRGQVTHLEANSLSLQLKKVLCKKIYLTPAVNKIHILGATHQRNCLDLNENEEDDIENLNFLANNFPKWSILKKIGNQVGIRGTSLDHLPLIGMLPDYYKFMNNFKEIHKGKLWSAYPNLTPSLQWLNIAHGSRGLTTIPLAAEILASQLNGEILPISRQIYQALQPQRFWVRDLCRLKKL
jgi:tRNA 5-methylaminomethyl-2-thiouridine biosynthesis bifunctional protein